MGKYKIKNLLLISNGSYRFDLEVLEANGFTVDGWFYNPKTKNSVSPKYKIGKTAIPFIKVKNPFWSFLNVFVQEAIENKQDEISFEVSSLKA